MNKAPEYRVGIGASSILMIFIILCLTTLGVLSFASARANLTLTQRRQAQVEAYYEAAAEAQQMIAFIDVELLKAQRDAENYDTYLVALPKLDDRLAVTEDGHISFSLPVGDRQKLEVELSANGAESPQRYTLLTHQTVNVADWKPDNSLTLMTF